MPSQDGTLAAGDNDILAGRDQGDRKVLSLYVSNEDAAKRTFKAQFAHEGDPGAKTFARSSLLNGQLLEWEGLLILDSPSHEIRINVSGAAVSTAPTYIVSWEDTA